MRRLAKQGFPAARVRRKIVLGGGDIADGKHFLVGSVVSRLIHKAVNLAVCVVP